MKEYLEPNMATPAWFLKWHCRHRRTLVLFTDFLFTFKYFEFKWACQTSVEFVSLDMLFGYIKKINIQYLDFFQFATFIVLDINMQLHFTYLLSFPAVMAANYYFFFLSKHILAFYEYFSSKFLPISLWLLTKCLWTCRFKKTKEKAAVVYCLSRRGCSTRGKEQLYCTLH